MGFAAPQRAAVPTSINRGNQDESWKAQGFLNFYVPTASGRRKVGYIPLKDSRAFDKAIIDRLTAGGDEALEALKEVLQVEFSTSEASEDNMPMF